MLFKDIIGQEEIKKRLIKSVRDNKIAHAQLFSGPEGIGKLQLAIAYAQYINCLDKTESDSCGICSSCIKFNKLEHPDLHFVFPIFQNKKEKKIICDDFISQWRKFNKDNPYSNLRSWLNYIKPEKLDKKDGSKQEGLIYSEESSEILKKLSYKTIEGKFKIMIIWHAEKMHNACANKVLKIMEEPSPNTLFILVADKPDDIIPTIISRTQRVNIRPIVKEKIETSLIDKFNISEQEANNIAHISKGSYFKALEIIQNEKETDYFFNLFKEMMRASFQRKIKKIKAISEEIADLRKEKQHFFINYSLGLLKEYFISNFKIEDIVYLRKDEMFFGEKFAPFVNERNVISLMDEFTLADRHIKQNMNPKMVFFDLGLKVTILLKK